MSYLCNLYQSGFVVGFFGILAYFFEGYKKRMNCISVHPFLYVCFNFIQQLSDPSPWHP